VRHEDARRARRIASQAQPSSRKAV
jgi:hypothetical protein